MGKGSPGLIAKMGTAEKLDQKIINPAADLQTQCSTYIFIVFHFQTNCVCFVFSLFAIVVCVKVLKICRN